MSATAPASAFDSRAGAAPALPTPTPRPPPPGGAGATRAAAPERFGVVLLAVLVAPLVGRPALAAESPPADVFVRAQIDELADVLTGGAPNRFEVLRARVRAVADFDGFAAKALGKTWGTLAAEEQQRFKTAMQGLLESHYMNKPGAIFDKNKVVVKEATPKDGSAAVRLTLKRKDVDVGVVVKVHPGPGAWIVDDVVIDGLSLLEDYRSQFQTFLKKKTVAELIAKLDAKAKANLGKKN